MARHLSYAYSDPVILAYDAGAKTWGSLPDPQRGDLSITAYA
ncbi:hypothetical protein [Neoaquamicrobium sediminum]|nr:hypothetical protein [Mesorhizobium sediminum]